MSRPKPIEVVIVGGGCAGMSAAFELTRPRHQGRYRVTVYQLGWRLGGKGASGRGPAEAEERCQALRLAGESPTDEVPGTSTGSSAELTRAGRACGHGLPSLAGTGSLGLQ